MWNTEVIAMTERNGYDAVQEPEIHRVSWRTDENGDPASEVYGGTQPDSAPVPVPAPSRPKRVRRVGMFTMGIALIFAGIIALLYMFFPDLNLISAIKYSPVLLILLGVEILVSGVIFRGDTIKYDFLSMIVCFFLICACVGVSAVYPMIQYYGPHLRHTEEVLSEEAADAYHQALAQVGDVRSVWVDVSIDALSADEKLTLSTLRPGDTVQLSVGLLGEYPGKEAFCEKAAGILQALGSAQPQADRVTIESGDSQYSLYLSTPFEMDFTADQLMEIVETEESVG